VDRPTLIVSVTAFPLVLGGAIAAAASVQASGGDAAALAGGLTFGAGALVAILERFFPHHRSWLHSKGDLGPDIAFALTIGAVSSLVVAPLVVYFGTSVLGWLSQRTGLALWPEQWPLLAQLPLGLVVAEFPKYWHHRLQHNTDLLWRFHATHHSAPRLYWLNAARFHPIDITVDGLLGGVTLVALGAGIEVIALFNLVSGIHGYFQHANLKLRLGPLNYVFSMAELHRWHHSKTMREANHNYGQNVIFWDLVFGSFFWPKDRVPPEAIGIPDLPAFPMSYLGQLASPFTWARIKRESASS
jgi:sterol desaturase/sphingolipid hydroxylase (fatty acid hydroxylase superfamily)